MTQTSAFQTIFQHVGAQLLSDVEGNASSLLTAFFTNIKANPTTQNVVAQGVVLAASAPLQLPNLEQAALSQIADAGLALLALLPKPTVS
jgi:hypothetical protein